jgi:hypothetical protein
MKPLFVAILSVIALDSFSQDVAPYNSAKFADGILTYDSVIQVPGASKAELFKRAMAFVAANFNSDKVIGMSDTSLGVMKINGNAEYAQKVSFTKQLYRVYFSIQILVKDGKTKYTISDIDYAPEQGAVGRTPIASKMFKDNGTAKSSWNVSGAVANLNTLAKNLETSMTNVAKIDTNF